jgi:adenylate kinase family enzyme
MSTAEERKKLAAEQYLAENRVRWLLENVTADLINFTPTRPHPFIVKRLREVQEKGLVPMHRRHLIAVVGGPACGKGMACAHVAQELGTVTIAPAELLRNEVKDGTEMGKRVGELLHADAVVPKEFVTELMRKKLDAYSGNAADEPAYVLDGFPRNLEQALHFESHGTELSKVIFLRASDDVLLKRMEQRSTDNGHEDEASAAQREGKLRDFKRATVPVIEYYKALGKLVVVDADQAPERVLALVENVVRK